MLQSIGRGSVSGGLGVGFCFALCFFGLFFLCLGYFPFFPQEVSETGKNGAWAVAVCHSLADKPEQGKAPNHHERLLGCARCGSSSRAGERSLPAVKIAQPCAVKPSGCGSIDLWLRRSRCWSGPAVPVVLLEKRFLLFHDLLTLKKCFCLNHTNVSVTVAPLGPGCHQSRAACPGILGVCRWLSCPLSRTGGDAGLGRVTG